MSEVITTAGRAGLAEALTASPAESPRREMIKRLRATLRKPEATDDEVDDALEALVELARTPDE